VISYVEAEVIFDDGAGLYLVKWDHICKLPSWAEKHERLPLAISPIKIPAGRVWWIGQA